MLGSKGKTDGLNGSGRILLSIFLRTLTIRLFLLRPLAVRVYGLTSKSSVSAYILSHVILTFTEQNHFRDGHAAPCEFKKTSEPTEYVVAKRAKVQSGGT